MSTDTRITGLDPEVLADLDAVMKRIMDGSSVDAATSRRIEDRANLITEQIRRRIGQVDIDGLLHEVRDES
jgi:hypothetical protein